LCEGIGYFRRLRSQVVGYSGLVMNYFERKRETDDERRDKKI